MRRFFVLFLMVVVLFSLSFSASASIGVDNEPFLFGVFDGIGGFFIDLISSMADYFSSLISALRNGINFVVGAIQKVIGAIGDAVGYLLNALKRLFIPNANSFSNAFDEITGAFNSKCGSLFSSFNYLKNRLSVLRANTNYREQFRVVFPHGSFFYGVSVDFLADTMPIFNFIRAIVTGFVGVSTAFICYNRIIGMINI